MSASIVAIFEWDPVTQTWKANFPGSQGVPGAADFTTMTQGAVYWVAIAAEGERQWAVPVP